MKIRKAEKRDIPGIMRLLVQVNMVHHNGRPDLFKGPTTKYTEEELALILQDVNTPVFVWTDEEDRVQGHAFCMFVEHQGERLLEDIKTLYIDDICVDENQRGRHIGKELFAHVISFAKENQCYNVTLNVWSCNPQAMKFYENCGMMPQKVGMEKILR